MTNAHKFILSFFAALAVFFTAVFGFMTWVDPFRNLNYPWAIDFVSDRNIAYKRLVLMRENKEYTDLVVGSSTSEVFRTEIFRDEYHRKSFIASNGGAGAALRHLIIKDAVEKNPQLERIIYVADLFELKDLFLYNEVYFQPEFQKLIDAETYRLMENPGFVSRLNDYLARKNIDRALRTLRDYKKYQKGQFASEFSADGTTVNSMVLAKPSEPFASRVHRTATEHDYLYKDMDHLHEPSKKMLVKTADFVKRHPKVRMDIVIAPVHPDYFMHFEAKFIGQKLYTRWVEFMRSLEGGNVKIHDFSYPVYLEKGITAGEDYWNDGVHFNTNAAKVILKDIYK